MTFEELYQKLVKAELDGQQVSDYNDKDLDCLLHPKNYAPVRFKDNCEECAYETACQKSCIFDALSRDEKGVMTVDKEKCVGCMQCVEACREQKIELCKDGLAAIKAVRNASQPTYALVAPAFLGQFSKEVTPGKLRSAFKALGFDGMVEVSLFADILTLKEALEFDHNIGSEGDYQLTSCCCPMWIAMIRKIYNQLMPHVPGSVSPMIACGRVIKKLYPNAVTVFVGPCVAKKSESREKDLAGAVDYVLTFTEVKELFDLANVDIAALPETEKDHSSKAGRIYAYAGGVSEAVKMTVQKLNPNRAIPVTSKCADGVPACKAMIEEIVSGKIKANFYEGMGCVGGCVGGPKSIIGKEQGAKNVQKYGLEAVYETPIDNPFVAELLKRMGFNSIEDLLQDSELLTRKF